MRKENEAQVHFIDNDNFKTILRKLLYHIPAVGDEIRIGGVGKEKYYKVIRRVFALDEPDCPCERVNIAIEECEIL
jgi:hypothetical protein